MNERRVTGTKEWAQKTANCLKGCSHDCKYCYAKSMAIRFGRKRPDTWHIEDPKPVRIGKACTGRPTRVMFPSTHDITPSSLPVCLNALNQLLEHGHTVLVVSKPHVDCIVAVCREFGDYRGQILFRFTVGSSNDATLKFWEPNAPSFMQRLDSLCFAHEQGFQTSVSCEPMLDSSIETVVDAVSPYVTDAIWIGKANQLRQRLRINGAADQETMRRAEALIASQSDELILELFERLRGNKLVKWKDSIKKVVGLDMPAQPGLDI